MTEVWRGEELLFIKTMLVKARQWADWQMTKRVYSWLVRDQAPFHRMTKELEKRSLFLCAEAWARDVQIAENGTRPIAG